MTEQYNEYQVTLHCTVTAQSTEGVADALQRSGIYVGLLIGEVLVDDYEIEDT